MTEASSGDLFDSVLRRLTETAESRTAANTEPETYTSEDDVIRLGLTGDEITEVFVHPSVSRLSNAEIADDLRQVVTALLAARQTAAGALDADQLSQWMTSLHDIQAQADRFLNATQAQVERSIAAAAAVAEQHAHGVPPARDA